MTGDLLPILESMEREKGISKEVLFAAIEAALLSAAKKVVGKNKEDITVEVDRETGSFKVISEGKEVKSAEFGRIAAQTAKQVIIQKIREAERDVVFEEYDKKQGGVTSGLVHRFDKGNIIVDLMGIEAVLPRTEQVPKERYHQGDRVRAYILEVKKAVHGPQIVLSRRAPEFVKKLFELEVPEILDGIVEIRGIVRDPGERTKMAVHSRDEKVDPVGSCVGVRGTRVKDIVRELHGERIDIVKYDDDMVKFLRNIMHPLEIKKMTIKRDEKRIALVVKDDQLSIGIGKYGQNIRLASKLLGWELDIRGETEPAPAIPVLEAQAPSAPEAVSDAESVPEDAPGGSMDVSAIKGVGKSTAKILTDAGFETVAKVASASIDDLVKLEGIGKKGAEKMISSAKELLAASSVSEAGEASGTEEVISDQDGAAAEITEEAEAVKEVEEVKKAEEAEETEEAEEAEEEKKEE